MRKQCFCHKIKMNLARFMRKSRHVGAIVPRSAAQQWRCVARSLGRSVNASLIKCPPSERSYSSCLRFPSALFNFFQTIFHKVYSFFVFFSFFFVIEIFYVCFACCSATCQFIFEIYTHIRTRTHTITYSYTEYGSTKATTRKLAPCFLWWIKSWPPSNGEYQFSRS